MANESYTKIVKSKGGFDRWSYNRIVEILDLIEGGGTGVQVPADWEADSGVTQVKNKPKINNKDLESGDNTLDDLGIQAKLESGVNIKKLKVNDTTHDIVGEGTVEITTGGSGGTGDYPDLTNKPKIEKSDGSSVEIVGVHSAEYYDLANKVHTHKVADITDLDIDTINTKLNSLDNAVNNLADSKQPRLVDGDNIATVTVNGTKHELTKEKDISITTGGGEGVTAKINNNVVEGEHTGDYYSLANLYTNDKVPATPVNGDLKVEKVEVEGVKHNRLSIYNSELAVWEELIQHFSGGDFSPDMESKFRTKQDTLIATGTGQNIKTINGKAILGKGDIVIEVDKSNRAVIAYNVIDPTPYDEGTFLITPRDGDDSLVSYTLRLQEDGSKIWDPYRAGRTLVAEGIPDIDTVNDKDILTVLIGKKLDFSCPVYIADKSDSENPRWIRLDVPNIKFIDLPDKPQLNGVTLVGDKNSTDLGLPVKAPEGQVILARSSPLPKMCKTGTIWIDVTYINIGTENKAMIITEDGEGTKSWTPYDKPQLIVDSLPDPAGDLQEGTIAVLRLTGYAPCSYEVYKLVSKKWVELECNYSYTQLQDKPFINETRVAGNKSLEDYGIQAKLIDTGEKQNIKTVNGESLLGKGDITISGGSIGRRAVLYLGTSPLDPEDYELGTYWLKCNSYEFAINQRTAEGNKEWVTSESFFTLERTLPDIAGVDNGAIVVVSAEGVFKENLPVYIADKSDTSNPKWVRLEPPVNYNSLSKKQEKLESGKSIKTVNGESILGSGNIEITGGDTKRVIYTPAGVHLEPDDYAQGTYWIYPDAEGELTSSICQISDDGNKEWDTWMRVLTAAVLVDIENSNVHDGQLFMQTIEGGDYETNPVFLAHKDDEEPHYWERIDDNISYAGLPDKPKINNYELLGNVTLENIGVHLASNLESAHDYDLLSYGMVQSYVGNVKEELTEYVDNKSADTVLLVKGEGFPDVYQNYSMSKSGDGKTPRTAVKTRKESYPLCPDGGTIMWMDNDYEPVNDEITNNMTLLMNPSSQRTLKFKESTTVMFKVAAHKKFTIRGANFKLHDEGSYFFNELIVDNTTDNVINITEDYIKEHAPTLRGLSEGDSVVNNYTEYIVLPDGVYERVGENVADDLATAKDSDLIPFGLVKEYVQSVLNGLDSEDTEFGG